MGMAKKEFDIIHIKIDKILELVNNTNVRLSVVETKLNYTSTAVDDQKNNLKDFIDNTVCQRKECAVKFKEIDSTVSKGQGAVWLIGIVALVVGIIGGVWGMVSGFLK